MSHKTLEIKRKDVFKWNINKAIMMYIYAYIMLEIVATHLNFAWMWFMISYICEFLLFIFILTGIYDLYLINVSDYSLQ